MNRRVFLQALAAGSATLAAGSILTGCSGLSRADLPGMTIAATPRGISEAHWRILHYASLAPSGHNAQPWRVKITAPQTWLLSVDPQRLLPAVDPTHRETLLSLGAFLENLAQSAAIFGFAAQFEALAADPLAPALVRIDLQPQLPAAGSLERLTSRRVVKSGLLPTELKSADVRALQEVWPDHLYYFPRGSRHAKCIAEETVAAMRRQCARDDAQGELAKWIRFTDAQAREARDGLTTEGMEIKGFAGWYVRRFFNAETVMSSSFREQTIAKTVKQTGEGGGWLILRGDGNSVTELLETGRRFERLFLTLRERMIAIHPMTQILEEAPSRERLAADHGPEHGFALCLRIGYLKRYPNPVSLRRSVDRFTRGS